MNGDTEDQSPTLELYLAHVRQEFRFLVDNYGFAEAENPTNDSFVVRYEKAETAIHIWGYDWGHAVDVQFGLQNAARLESGQNYLKDNRPDIWQSVFHTRGQLRKASKWAKVLPEAFPTLLDGDLSLLPALQSSNGKAVDEQRAAERNPRPRNLP